MCIRDSPSSYYTHSTKIEIDGTRATLTVSLFQTEGTSEEHMNAYNIGELSASIRLSFEEVQNNGETYVILLALLYACILKNAGVDSSIIHQLLIALF